MPTLCDVNVLLALSYDRHIHHIRSLAWLDAQETEMAIVCRSTQLSLLRLLCNATIMNDDVCSTSQAWDVYDTILSDDRFAFYYEPNDLEITLREFSKSAFNPPKLWQDIYLAAFAVSSNLQLVTFDQGFRQFSSLRLTLLEG